MIFLKRFRSMIFFYGAKVFLGFYPLNIIFLASLLGGIGAYQFSSITMAIVASIIFSTFLTFMLKNIRSMKKFNTIKIDNEYENTFDCHKVDILHLDDSLNQYKDINKISQELDMRHWGKQLRIASPFYDFMKFEQKLNDSYKENRGICFFGHNDFDHVSLAFLRNIKTPFNLLLLDAHADWHNLYHYSTMFGSWVMNAFQSTNIQNLLHVGGHEEAFDNKDHWWDSAECYGSALDMQKFIDQGRISLLPGDRSFNQDSFFDYSKCYNLPLIKNNQLDQNALNQFIETNREKLEKYPLYIAIDKDVLRESDNVQKWREGVLSIAQLEEVLKAAIEASNRNLVGASICGEYGDSSFESIFHPGWISELLTNLIYPKTNLKDLSYDQNYNTNDRIIKIIQTSLDRLTSKD